VPSCKASRSATLHSPCGAYRKRPASGSNFIQIREHPLGAFIFGIFNLVQNCLIYLTIYSAFWYDWGNLNGQARRLALEGLPYQRFDMRNYTKQEGKNQALLPYLPTFWLNFSISGDPTEWIAAGLPVPNFIAFTNRGAMLGWQIDGYFGTKRGIEYLNDTIGSITIALKEASPKRLPWKPDLRTADHYYPKIHKLKEFSGLRSVNKRVQAPKRADSFDDHAFWAIKLWTEDQIRGQGEGLPVVYETLEDWALSQFIDKERSTIRAKCRSVWNWYEGRDWTLPKDKRKFEMSRQDHIKKVHANRNAKAQAKIRAVLEDMFIQDQIKTKAGKLKVSAIAKIVDMHRDTVAKHLKEMGLHSSTS